MLLRRWNLWDTYVNPGHYSLSEPCHPQGHQTRELHDRHHDEESVSHRLWDGHLQRKHKWHSTKMWQPNLRLHQVKFGNPPGFKRWRHDFSHLCFPQNASKFEGGKRFALGAARTETCILLQQDDQVQKWAFSRLFVEAYWQRWLGDLWVNFDYSEFLERSKKLPLSRWSWHLKIEVGQK